MQNSDQLDDIIKSFLGYGNYGIAEEFALPAKPESVRPVPEGYRDPVFRRVMNAFGLPPNTLWTHQSEALDVIDNGMSAVLSTATASGKTLIFQLASLKKILNDPDARVLALYPTKALNNDQRLSWQKLFDAAGLPPEKLGLIDGDTPMEGRLQILSDSRITIMTPDAVHAWLMSNIDKPQIKEFIANIQLKVLDEAHLYDGSFGTHFSYLLRRMKFVQSHLNPAYDNETHGQIIAASATMHDPDRFLKDLTGNEFYSIGPEWDGSPRHEQKYTLIGTPDFRQKEAAGRFLTLIGGQKTLPGTTICFVDNRTAVDEIANEVNSKLGAVGDQQLFAAYKGGLASDDRGEIESDIRTGTSRGVIATSALEVGIHIDGVRQVVMAGLPEDAAAFRQRAGRLRSAGHIIVFEEQNAIESLNLSIKNKLHEPPRQPILYRGNTKLIAEEAVCFLDEAKKLGISRADRALSREKAVAWPRGFYEAVSRYVNDEELAEEYLAALPPAHVPPQRYHSLRSYDGPSRRIITFDRKLEKYRTLGDVSQSQALSEAFPGAVVYFRGRPYRVAKWSEKVGSNRPIFARPLTGDEYASKLKTKGYVKTSVITYLNDLRILGNRYRTNKQGDFFADVKITVVKNISGFSEQEGKNFRRVFYNSETRKTLSPSFSSRAGVEISNTDDYRQPAAHSYDTTGVVMRIGNKWFGKKASRQISKMMHQAMCDEFNIAPRDLHVTVNNVRIGLNGKTTVEDKAIVVYDKTPGSLYLSRKLFVQFPRVIARMIDQCTDTDMERWILELYEWHKGMRLQKAPTYKQFVTSHIPEKLPKGQELVYSPGSILYWKRKGEDDALRVKVTAIDIIQGNLVYGIKEVGYDYNPFRMKGERSTAKAKVKPQSYLVTQYVNATQLEEPPAATYRFAVYDMKTRTILEDKAPETGTNDNLNSKGQGGTANGPAAKP